MAEETLSSKLIFSGRAIKVRVDTVKTASGRKTSREIVEHSDCVAIVAVDEDENVLLESQFRKPVERELLEIPAGGIEAGEDAETAVRRELQEEIGYLPRKVERLGGFYSAPGYSSEYLYLYLATDLVPSKLQAEDTEEIKLERVKVNKIPEMILSGKICDAKSIAGLLAYLALYKNRASPAF